MSYIPIAYYLILHNSTLNFSNLLFSFLNACLISLRYHYLPQTSLTLASASLLVFTLLTGQLPVLTQWDSWVLSLPVLFSKESGMANYSCGQMHKWKEPAGGTVEYKAWWLPIRQKEAVCVVPWWFQF